ncbi:MULTISPECIES: DUF1566 domain-containing protein [unclassified Pseudomonas]|uniref:DUF1566 domain-containing protein n=1 Tax=unclassified Pseudomonas TaxID=196821 RepID=UPI0014764813|nr:MULTISPECIES: DUF1566 domain-containing protein [unclassified Pseudomonas]NMX92042.1 DUF1566 domain-containing protein [Pseudomonas sp. WS 5086]NMY46876.1 DUF1566 domain-containing protein [Pseudomonas sp. WS 5027]
MRASELTTYTRGDLTISSPDQGVVLKLATLAIAAAPAIAASGIPAIGEYWPGEGGINGGLFPGGDKLYYLIVPTGSDAEATHEWGGYGQELDGAKSPWDGQANTAYLANSNREHDHSAAQFCATFERDGHKDFYLMARREASFLEITVPEVFSKAYHWTSTQRSADLAYSMGFGVGWLYVIGKGYERLARPVRRKFI